MKAKNESDVIVELDLSTTRPGHAKMLQTGIDVPFAIKATKGKIEIQFLGSDAFDERAVGRIGSDGQVYWALDALEGDDSCVLKDSKVETSKVAEPIMSQVRAWFNEEVQKANK